MKHILSKEIQLYFENVCSALLDEGNHESQVAALESIKTDPGLHQLVPYFVQFIADKITHDLTNLFVLEQMMHLTSSMLQNETIYVDPYVCSLLPKNNPQTRLISIPQVASLVPPVLTCLVGRHLGSPTEPLSHYTLRNTAAALLGAITQKYSKSSHALRPRLARTCLKHFLDPTKPLATNYGGILGLQKIGGPEVVRVLIVPNLKDFEILLRDDTAIEDEIRTKEKEIVLQTLINAISLLEDESVGSLQNGLANGDGMDLATRLREKVGDLVADKLLELGRPRLVKAVLEC